MLENPIKMQRDAYVVGAFSGGCTSHSRSAEAAQDVIIKNFRRTYYPTVDRVRKRPFIVVSVFIITMVSAFLLTKYTTVDISAAYIVAIVVSLGLPLFPMSRKVKSQLRKSMVQDHATAHIIVVEAQKAFMVKQQYLKEQIAAYEQELQSLSIEKFQAKALDDLEKKVYGGL